MQPLVQSAIDAANRGENNKAMEFLKQALAANPSDVDAWLVVAAVVEQPERKRQCLNRVLSLDPTNQIARDELLEMDRAAMGGTPSPFFQEPAPSPAQPAYQSAPPPPSYPTSTSAFESDPASQSISQPAPPSPGYPSSTSAFETESVASQSQAKATPAPSFKAPKVRFRVFKYSAITRVMVYVSAALFAILSIISIAHPILLCIPCSLLLLTLPGIWIVSGEVEINEKEIVASHLFGLVNSQAGWGEISSLKSHSSSLELLTKKGKRVKVTTQVSGYPAIVETLQQQRPDLFGGAAVSSTQANVASGGAKQVVSSSRSSSVPAPAASGARTFRKSFFKQYGINFITISFCVFSAMLSFEDPTLKTATVGTAAFCLFVLLFTLFQVSAIKVEPNKLTVETLFERKVFTARQIREIKMQSVRGRYGRVTNFVNIIPEQGKNYPLQGFSGGDEVIYGFLTNWLNTYQGS